MSTDTSTNGIAELEVGNGRSWWEPETDAIHTALTNYYGRDVAPEALTPPRDPAALRTRLREAAPQLTALTDQIRQAFEIEQACAVVIPKVGLGGLGLDDKRRGIFALAALLGDPTANIPFDHVLWDVRNQGDKASGHTSFSENDHKAGYHTDNGTLPVPERFFLLYAVRAAQCEGGMSLVRDGRTVKKQLEETEEGRAAVRVLSETNLPRRVPPAFDQYGQVAADGLLYAPVLADKPMWRWRKGGIRRGIVQNPDYDTPEIRQALHTVIDLLNNGPEEIRLIIPTDGLLIINNHIALHGRTAFTDPERHLLRLRFHEPSH